MRSILIPAAGFLLLMCSMTQAAVSIIVDKDNQKMTVSVDGVQRYTWPVSSGNPSYETPSGNYRAFRMEEDHYSKEFDDAPMPNSIFFTKQGHAIHGTDVVNRLGTPASHGCVRLSRANALKLWDLVKEEGLLNTTVTLTGSAQVAVARGRGIATARQDFDTDYSLSQDRVYMDQYSQQDGTYYYGAGNQRWPTPPQRRIYSDPRGGYYQGFAQDRDPYFRRPQQYAPRRSYGVY